MVDNPVRMTAMKMLEFIEIHQEELISSRPFITGIQDAQYRLLFHLVKFPEISMTTIGKSMGFTKSYMTKLVDPLIEEGYLERYSDPNDRRFISIVITESGKAKLQEARELMTDDIMQKISLISPEDLITTLNSLDKLLAIYWKYRSQMSPTF